MSIRVDLATDKPRRWADAEDIVNGAYEGDWIPHVGDLMNVYFVSGFETKNTIAMDVYVRLPKYLLPRKSQLLLQAEFNPYYVAFSEPDKFETNFPKIIRPRSSSRMEFNNTIFNKSVDFSKLAFEGVLDFSNSVLGEDADFSDATFTQFTAFNSVIFASTANFNNSKFKQVVSFDNTIFCGFAFFNNATFTQAAIFKSSTFFDRAYFNNTNFADWAIFPNTTFAHFSLFNNTQFSGLTSFSATSFKLFTPNFHGVTELYSDTRFSDDPENWPAPSPDHQSNYERLRYLTNKAMLHDAERFLECQIMRCKEVEDRQKGNWGSFIVSKLYGGFGEYGSSWALPLQWLLVFTLMFGVIFAALEPSHIRNGFDLFNISISNGFGFLSAKRDALAILDNAPKPWTVVTMWTQSIVNLPLLFLFGLGVRSRFRVK